MSSRRAPYRGDRTGTTNLGRSVDKRRDNDRRDRRDPRHRRLAALLPSAYQKGNVLGTFRQEFVTQSFRVFQTEHPEQNKSPESSPRELNLKLRKSKGGISLERFRNAI